MSFENEKDWERAERHAREEVKHHFSKRNWHGLSFREIEIHFLKDLIDAIDERAELLDAERERVWQLTNAIKDHKQAKLDFWEGDAIRAEVDSTDADKKLWALVEEKTG